MLKAIGIVTVVNNRGRVCCAPFIFGKLILRKAEIAFMNMMINLLVM